MIDVAQLVKDLSKNIYDEEVRAEFESEVSYYWNFMAKRFQFEDDDGGSSSSEDGSDVSSLRQSFKLTLFEYQNEWKAFKTFYSGKLSGHSPPMDWQDDSDDWFYLYNELNLESLVNHNCCDKV